MGPKKDNDSSKLKRKNTNIMIDVKKEIIAKHERVLVSLILLLANPLPNNNISLPHHLPLTPSTLLHTGTVKLN
jgi:hypothetical protein